MISFSSFRVTEINTVSPPGLLRSDIEEVIGGYHNYSRLNVSWTPTAEQAPENIFCYAATNAIGYLIV